MVGGPVLLYNTQSKAKVADPDQVYGGIAPP